MANKANKANKAPKANKANKATAPTHLQVVKAAYQQSSPVLATRENAVMLRAVAAHVAKQGDAAPAIVTGTATRWLAALDATLAKGGTRVAALKAIAKLAGTPGLGKVYSAAQHTDKHTTRDANATHEALVTAAKASDSPSPLQVALAAGVAYLGDMGGNAKASCYTWLDSGKGAKVKAAFEAAAVELDNA